MNFFDALKRVTRPALNEALLWLILNLSLIVLPIFAVILNIYTNTGQLNLREPISHGELSLVSISLLGDGILVISKGLKILEQTTSGKSRTKGLAKIQNVLRDINFPGGRTFIVLIFVEALVALVYFMNSFSQNTTLSNYQQILDFRIISTIVITVLCLLTTFSIALVDASISNSTFNIEELYKNETNEWQDKMNKREWRS